LAIIKKDVPADTPTTGTKWNIKDKIERG